MDYEWVVTPGDIVLHTYRTTFSIKRLWLILIVCMIVMFSVLGYFGGQIYQQVPPIPERVETLTGEILYTRAAIEQGQNVWQSIGGMQQGSIWGHGSYLAPDWSADWLHREAEALLKLTTAEEPATVEMPAVQRAAVAAISMRSQLRTNTFDLDRCVIVVSRQRARAMATVAEHYRQLFTASDKSARQLRVAYAFPVNAVLDNDQAHALGAFFFWSAWSAVTNRPGNDISYTSNWPHDPLIRRPTTGTRRCLEFTEC